jgi:hypothetical protein
MSVGGAMKTKSLPFVFVIAILMISVLACELSAQPLTRQLQFVSIAVSPTESDGLALIVDVVYMAVGNDDQVDIACYYQSSSGIVQINAGQQAAHFADVRSSEMVFPFSVTQPGIYQAYCTSSDGAQSSTAPFRVTEPSVKAEPTQPEVEPVPPAQPQPQSPPVDQNSTCQWQVAGTWNITQNNGYHPTFVITQNGTALTGSGTLTASETTLGGYTGSTGNGTGSVDGNVFTFIVTWPPKTDGKTISGTYSGTITEGRIDGDTWFGAGPSQCVNP